MRWQDLVAVLPADAMHDAAGAAAAGPPRNSGAAAQGGAGAPPSPPPPPSLVQVNSGGAVFFLLFAPPGSSGGSSTRSSSGGGGSSGPVSRGSRSSGTDDAAAPLPQWPSRLSSPWARGSPASSSGGGGTGDDAGSRRSRGTSGGGGGGGGGDGSRGAEAGPAAAAPPPPLLSQHRRREGVAVVKVAASRLAVQAEQFANELALFLGVAAPPCRIVRSSGDGAAEHAAARAAAEALGDAGEGLAAEIARLPCFLLMGYVPGRPLLEACGAVLAAAGSTGKASGGGGGGGGGGDNSAACALLADVGRLLLLDLLLGNADRLPLPELGWRGNPANVLLGAPGAPPRYAGRAVAIDSSVPRRPPALKSCAEDAAAERLAQLLLAAPGDGAAAAILAQLLGAEAAAAAGAAGLAAFRAGFRAALERAARVRGLLEMAQGATAGWVAEFLDDVAPLVPGLKGPQGAALPVPVSELAAGMRTPPHLASPRPGSARPSPRPSPRGSFHNRDPAAGAAVTGGGAGSPTPAPPLSSSPLPVRANSRGAARSPILAAQGRAHSCGLAGALQLPPMSPASSAGFGPATDADTPPGGGGSIKGSLDGLPQALRGGGAFARLSPRALFSAPGADAPPVSAGGVVIGLSPRLNRCASASARRASCDEAVQRQQPSPSPSQPPPGQQQQPDSRAASPGGVHMHAPCRRAASSAALSPPQRSPRDLAGAAAAAAMGPELRAASASSALAAAVSSALASIASEARHDGALADRVAAWKERFRARGAELAAAIADWQARQANGCGGDGGEGTGGGGNGKGSGKAESGALLTTGFLAGSTHPLVDAYELAARLEHLLRRLAALAGAAAARAPAEVAPRVFLGGAVAADATHLLAHLGVTHVLNATEELLPPPPAAGFAFLRLPLRDDEAEDVSVHFERAAAWVDAALAGGGAVLVHCHEGRSRSVALVAAWLMASRGLALREALAAMRAARPEAQPNPGFLAALAELDAALRASRGGGSGGGGGCGGGGGGGGEGAAAAAPLSREECALLGGRRGKPAARVCPLCGDAVGVSGGSLVVHMRARHRGNGGGGGGGGGAIRDDS